MPRAAVAASQIVSVDQTHSARVRAGTAIATISIPAAISGSGTLTFIGASPAADAAIFPPEIPIAVINVTPSASATYASLPTFSFLLPNGSATTNVNYILYVNDPATGIEQGVVEYLASPVTEGVALSINPAPFFTPQLVGAPPLLPITYSATNAISFVLYEIPTTPN